MRLLYRRANGRRSLFPKGQVAPPSLLVPPRSTTMLSLAKLHICPRIPTRGQSPWRSCTYGYQGYREGGSTNSITGAYPPLSAPAPSKNPRSSQELPVFSRCFRGRLVFLAKIFASNERALVVGSTCALAP